MYLIRTGSYRVGRPMIVLCMCRETPRCHHVVWYTSVIARTPVVVCTAAALGCRVQVGCRFAGNPMLLCIGCIAPARLFSMSHAYCLPAKDSSPLDLQYNTAHPFRYMGIVPQPCGILPLNTTNNHRPKSKLPQFMAGVRQCSAQLSSS